MARRVLEVYPGNRAREKQASRDEDARRLALGLVDRETLTRENDFFAALDPSKFRIVAIGNRPLSIPRKP